jgi:pyruvate/2-oxoglutarate/acetoin dehydrogenase E1 component
MRSGGIGASISAWISENLLEDLDHEVIRLSSQDVPTAYAKLLEDGTCPATCREPSTSPLLTLSLIHI